MRRFFDGDGLAGEGGFISGKIGRFQNSGIRRDPVPGSKENNVSRNDLSRRDVLLLSIADHPSPGGSHLLQRLDGLLGTTLLDESQYSTGHYEDENHPCIEDLTDGSGNHDRSYEYEDEDILELIQEDLQWGCLRLLLEDVGPILLQPSPCLNLVETLRARSQGSKDLLTAEHVPFFPCHGYPGHQIPCWEKPRS